MEKSTNLKISEYLEYLATICLVLSDDIKNHETNINFNLVKQNIDELSNHISNIRNIMDNDGIVFSGAKLDDITKTIRDFKIKKILK